MAKSKSIHPISGKLDDRVYVDSKDGYLVRKAPKKLAARKRCSLRLMGKKNELVSSIAWPAI